MGHLPVYAAWSNMKQRCYNVNHPQYKDYGARGVTVCKRWRNSSQLFADDMGQKPDGYTLERIDNTKGYSPDNCCWDTRKAQTLNKRDIHRITHDGETLTIKEWAVKFNIKYSTLYYRLVAKKLPLCEAVKPPKYRQYKI